MKRLLTALTFIPTYLFAQDPGIHFEQDQSWTEIQAKAKSENKYIFMDCYATWCGPCKAMDKDIYPLDSIGNYMNDKFISVKVQFDSSKSDNETVRNWYADANKIAREFKISSLPSFLFFSPNGKIVHQDAGYKNPGDFIGLVSDAQNPDKQIYTRLAKYQGGQKDYPSMPGLANSVKSLLKDDKLAISIAQDYLVNYLYKLDEHLWYTKENIEFIAKYTQGTKDKGFEFFSKHVEKIDLLVRPHFSQDVFDYFITKEEINAKLYRDGNFLIENPDWSKLTSIISSKYSEATAKRIVINSQITWYQAKKDWSNLAKYYNKKVDLYGLDTAGTNYLFINDFIWQVIFLHIDDKKMLNKAISWMEITNSVHPNDIPAIDTYANLLYKIKRITEAINWEQKALEMEEHNAIKENRKPDGVYEETLKKMQKGERTWIAS